MLVSKFKGHSNSHVVLLREDGKYIVHKSGDIQRNLDRYKGLDGLINIPKILDISDLYYTMEYIPNLDMRSYLANHDVNVLANFIVDTIAKLSEGNTLKDYTETYIRKLSEFDFELFPMPFTKEELLEKLPKTLPKSNYHGDFTMDNILYSVNTNEFVMIDPLTTEYDSYIFDIAKLRQDLICKWFIRNDNLYYDSKLKIIENSLADINDYLLILMLMRVLPYTKKKFDRDYLLKEINKLWK